MYLFVNWYWPAKWSQSRTWSDLQILRHWRPASRCRFLRVPALWHRQMCTLTWCRSRLGSVSGRRGIASDMCQCNVRSPGPACRCSKRPCCRRRACSKRNVNATRKLRYIAPAINPILFKNTGARITGRGVCICYVLFYLCHD